MTNQRPTIDQQITWIYTDDLEESADFYGNILALELAVDEGTARVYRVSGMSFVGVCQAWGDREILPAGTCLTFVTDEVDQWFQYLTDRGVPMDGEPHELPQSGIYACFARDPSGYRIEFQRYLTPVLS